MRLAGLSCAFALALAACGPAGGPRVGGKLYTQDKMPDPSALGTVTRDPVANDPNVTLDPSCPEATLPSLREKIFVPSCATSECHAGANAPHGLDLSLELDALRGRLSQPAAESPSGMPLVHAGRRGGSYLFLKVYLETPLDGSSMPPSAPLADCAVEALGAWIDSGTP